MNTSIKLAHTSNIEHLTAVRSQLDNENLCGEQVPWPQPLSLIRLSLTLLYKSSYLGKPEYIEQAISYQKQALALTPEGHPHRSEVLNALGTSFQTRFERRGERNDISEAISYIFQAIEISPERPDPLLLSNLGCSYYCRFVEFAKLKDLENAISFKAQAMFYTARNSTLYPTLLNEIGSLLQARFTQLGDTQDINHAVIFQKQSIVTGPRVNSHSAPSLENLGRSLLVRFEYLDKKEDIDESINYFRRAVKLTPDGHVASKAARINKLAFALAQRFDHRGILADLDESIQHYNQVLLLVHDDHLEKTKCMANLGYSLRKRFERLGNVNDINQAISHQEQSVLLSMMHGTCSPVWCNNLGGSLMYRFEYLGNASDLDKSIRLFKWAVDKITFSVIFKSRFITNLAHSLRKRFELRKRLEDIDCSIEYFRKALSFDLDHNGQKAECLSNLGGAYITRFKHLGRRCDLEDCIKYLSAAATIFPEGHTSKLGMLLLLGESYGFRFDYSHDPSDLMLSVSAFHEAAYLPSGKPYLRFEAALCCAKPLSSFALPRALKLCKLSMDLLPQIVWLGTTIQYRYENIPSIGSAVTEAIARAIDSQHYELALEWLEQGRSIIWQQTLNLRTSFDDLSRVDARLANRLEEIARQLDHKSAPKSMNPDHQREWLNPEREAQAHRRLAEEWEQILDRVRQISGFQSFMRPRRASELVQSARTGVVVAINIDELRCDALILRPKSQGVMHVPLPDFSQEKVTTAYNQLTRSLVRKGIRERGFQAKHKQNGEEFGSILSLLWSDVVRPVLKSLGYLQVASTDHLPHITWCTTGHLSFLPLHAAGCYSEPHERVYNYAISSYTPTLSALLTSDRSPCAFRGILTVGQTNTPGFQSLPGAAQELSSIQEQAKNVRYTELAGQNATTTAVLDAIEQHSWVHFACHASQNASDPTASAFHLYDGPLSLATIMQKSFKHADLAFLSACQTAKGDSNLPGEAVHLAAGMLMAGFPSVIATMWSIRDEDAPLIAEEVYAQLLEGGKPDSRRAAKALHMAVERLREKVGEKAFTSWIPYVHLGV
ncbi:hypothetical protein BDV93DRAFT_575046 [Ceratobasidium sp. AG-I]|nr:hypothetical protein BDV93DRAFT_575046 [Ceratobasidium sp. AG-I]